ncbi:MAG: Ig-like domain-containing protein [Candidatus Eremiobacterota bacterium]
MSVRIRALLLVLFLAFHAIGCTEDIATGGGGVAAAPAPAVPTGNVRVLFDLQPRLIPLIITQFRFTALDANGQTVFGPVLFGRQATVLLERVPTSIRQLRIELLVGEQVVGIFTATVALGEGQTVEVTNIEWSDVLPPPSLLITPDPAVIPVGQPGTFTATRDPQGVTPTDATNNCVWTSSNAAVLRVDNPGRVTALAPGTATLTATLGTLSDTVEVTVTNATVLSLSFAPNPGRMMGQFQFRLIGLMSDGQQNDFTTQGQWSSDNTGVFTVDNAGAKGLATTVSLGTANLQASYAGLSTMQAVQTQAGGSLITFNGTNAAPGNNDSTIQATFLGAHGMSADGRFVAFASAATDLLPAGSPVVDGNGFEDVYVRDTVSGVNTLVSVDLTGTASGNNFSRGPVISPDGRYVLFTSQATDLVATPVPVNVQQVYRRDLVTGTTELVSLNQDAVPVAADAFCDAPSLSDDGNLACYFSNAGNLPVTGSGADNRVLVRNMTTGTVTVANLDNQGNLLDANFSGGSICGNGQIVVFSGEVPPVPPALFPDVQVFARNLGAGLTVQCSIPPQGASSPGFNLLPLPSRDGTLVYFTSLTSSGLDPAGRTGTFSKNLSSGALTFVTPELAISSSADGRFLVTLPFTFGFFGFGGNPNVRDTQTGAVNPVVVSRAGLPIPNSSVFFLGAGLAEVSPDGTRLTFNSMSDQIDPVVTTTNILQIFGSANPLFP